MKPSFTKLLIDYYKYVCKTYCVLDIRKIFNISTKHEIFSEEFILTILSNHKLFFFKNLYENNITYENICMAEEKGFIRIIQTNRNKKAESNLAEITNKGLKEIYSKYNNKWKIFFRESFYEMV